MLQSHVIVIDGAFVGVAVRLHAGYRFIAVDNRLDDFDGDVLPTLPDIQRIAHRLFRVRRPQESVSSHDTGDVPRSAAPLAETAPRIV